jgi:hypothetical protein
VVSLIKYSSGFLSTMSHPFCGNKT